MRIGKSVVFKTKSIFKYYHPKCAFESFNRARLAENIITCINEIDGLESITNEEKMQVMSMIDDANAARTMLLPQAFTNKIVPRRQMQEPSKLRGKRLKTSNLPTIKVMFTNADQLTTSKMIELKNKIESE